METSMESQRRNGNGFRLFPVELVLVKDMGPIPMLLLVLDLI
jgi:hypothetical protein